MKNLLGSIFSGEGEMARLMASFDWSSTPLGPAEAWPQSLRTSLSLILGSQHPMWIGWGPEMTFLYNDAYISVLSLAKHPGALGRPAHEVWSEIWDVCGPLADKVFSKGEASFQDDVRLFMNRGDFLEETFYSFSYSPIRDEGGRVGGLFCPSAEVTGKNLNARRLRTLSVLSEESLVEKSVSAACSKAAETLATNPDDIPFAMLYLLSTEQQLAWKECAAGTTDGVGLSEAISLAEPPLRDADARLVEVLYGGGVRYLAIEDAGRVTLGPAGQPVREAIIVPVTAPGEAQGIGVLVAGINPTRKLDEDYRTFFNLIAGQIGTAIANARAYEDESNRAEALAELDRTKTLFFSNVSHEFRTPLTLMLGPLEDLLSTGKLEPEVEEGVGAAYRNSLRLLRLVNTLLDFTRIESGRVEAVFEPTDIAELTTDLASTFRTAIERAGLELVVECPPVAQDVYLDRDMWEKIVLNLISNALKFTFEGHIRITITEHKGSVELTVSDTGTGIPESELPHLFERFHRVRDARARTYEGSGIGLALVQELARIHGGQVVVESVYGEGTTFRVAIPTGSSHLPEDRVEVARKLPSTAAGATSFVAEALRWLDPETAPDGGSESDTVEARISELRAQSPEATSTVLVVDDNADMREYISRLLSVRWNVVTAPDGEAALHAAINRQPDLVISDVMMPRMDGFELLVALRGLPETSTTPVILLSARAGEESRIEGLQAGADDYLAKPFAARELIARVTSHLELAALRNQRQATIRRGHDTFLNLIQNSPFGVYLIDSRFRLAQVSLGAQKVFENVRPLIGHDFAEALRIVWNEPFASEVIARFRHTLETGEPYVSYDTTEVRGDVEAVESYDWRIERVTLPDGTFGVVCYFYDLTNQRRVEQDLRESEERFRQMANHAPVMVWVTEEDGYCSFLSDSWYEFSGQTPETGLGYGWLAATHPEDREEVERIFREASQNHEAFAIEYRILHKDGGHRWTIDSAAPRIDAEGNFHGYIGSVIDITDRKKAEEEMSAASALKDQFLGLVSHELRTPISTIIANGALLHRYGDVLDDEDRQQALADIVSEGARLQEIIENMLLLTRMETTQALELESLSVADLASECVESFKLRRPGRDITVTNEANGTMTLAHPSLIAMVLDNLLNNADKYSPPDAAIELKIQAGSDGIEVHVHDHGIGVEEQDMLSMFTPYFRTKAGREYASGTGLGLAVCKRIIAAHEGSIWVERRQEGGSDFAFRLPYAPEEDQAG